MGMVVRLGCRSSRIASLGVGIVKIVSSEKGFLGLNRPQTKTTHQAQAFIIPFGYEDKEDSGCGAAPQAIIAASRDLNLFDERYGCHPHREISITTLKEVYLTKRARQAWQQLQNLQETFSNNGQFALILGGENGLLSAVIPQWLNQYNDMVLVHLGAHGGIIYELGSQYPYLTIQGFGLRSINEPLYQLAKEQCQRIALHYGSDHQRWDWSSIKKSLAGKKVYLSVSVDFDMSVLPTTPYPEPGGMFWDGVMTCIECFASHASIVGAFLGDFSPNENMPAYDILIAKLAYRLISTVFLEPTFRPDDFFAKT